MPDLISRLVDKSLVVAEARGGGLRYRLLGPVHQYGRERLEESGESNAVRRRHAAFFVTLAEEAGPELKGLRQAECLERLETEINNLRAAMRWLLEKDEIEGAARSVFALWMFWLMHGHQREGRRWSEEALAKSGHLPVGVQANAVMARANASYGLESPELTTRLCEEAAVLFREAGDRDGLALAVGGGGAAMLRLSVERAIALIEKGFELWRESGDRWGVSMVHAHLGIAYLIEGAHARATRHFEEALALSKEIGNRFAGYISLYNWALVAQSQGDHERAAELYVEVSDRANTAYCLEALAGLVGARGESERAVRLFGAAEALLKPLGSPRYPHTHDRTLYEQAIASLRSRLGEPAFAAAWAEGQAMALEKGVEYALGTAEVVPTMAPMPERAPADGPKGAPSLTCREREVAPLVARGLTDRQVASEPSISERTVSTHVSRILGKLGLRSRAQVTASMLGLLPEDQRGRGSQPPNASSAVPKLRGGR